MAGEMIGVGTRAGSGADEDDGDELMLLWSSDSMTTHVPHPMSSQVETFPARRNAASNLRLCDFVF